MQLSSNAPIQIRKEIKILQELPRFEPVDQRSESLCCVMQSLFGMTWEEKVEQHPKDSKGGNSLKIKEAGEIKRVLPGATTKKSS